jgi:hypothetical protein
LAFKQLIYKGFTLLMESLYCKKSPMIRLCLFFVIIYFSLSLQAQTQKEIDDYFEELGNKPVKLIGRPIPAFKGHSTSGQLYTEDSLQSKVTVLNLWFEACAPCIAEMAALNDMYHDFKPNNAFQFLSFTFEKAETIERMRQKYKIEYPIIPISVDSCYILNFRGGFPANIISDKKGKLAYYSIGGSTKPESNKANFLNKMYPVIESLLKKEE